MLTITQWVASQRRPTNIHNLLVVFHLLIRHRSRKVFSMTEISSLVLGMALLATASCNSKPPQVNSANHQNSGQAEMRNDIKARWEQESKALDKEKAGKDYPGKKLDLLIKILKQAPTTQVNAEQERVSRETKDYDHMEEYDRYLLQALVAISAKANDRDRLVKLLSTKSPRFIAASALELEIASLEIKHPLLILFDSYDKATGDERRYLADILRHAFLTISKDHPNDAEFVDASKAWYLENASETLRLSTHPQRRVVVFKVKSWCCCWLMCGAA